MDPVTEITYLFDILSTPEKRKLVNTSTFLPYIKDYHQPNTKLPSLQANNDREKALQNNEKDGVNPNGETTYETMFFKSS